MRWTREEYIELLTYGRVKRPMLVELFGPLIGLEDEWRAQGATEDEINLTAFDFDYVPRVGCGGNTGLFGGFKTCVIEETADHVISRDELGRTVKLCKGRSLKLYRVGRKTSINVVLKPSFRKYSTLCQGARFVTNSMVARLLFAPFNKVATVF